MIVPIATKHEQMLTQYQKDLYREAARNRLIRQLRAQQRAARQERKVGRRFGWPFSLMRRAAGGDDTAKRSESLGSYANSRT